MKLMFVNVFCENVMQHLSGRRMSAFCGWLTFCIPKHMIIDEERGATPTTPEMFWNI